LLIIPGFNFEGKSWWRCRNVLGTVLAGVRGVKSVCGWIGPCPGVAEPPTKPWIRIRARPVEFLRSTDTGDIDDMSDDGSDEDDYSTSRRLFVPHSGETVHDVIQDLSNMSLWTVPVPPAKVNMSCSISKIDLKALPLEATGSIDCDDDRTDYRASITFQFTDISGTSDVIYTLYTNPTFVSTHPCIGTHVVHRREMIRYQDNVIAVKDLKSHEGGGGRKVLVINAQCNGGEAIARAWCAERGKHAVVRRGKSTCFTCSVTMADREGLGVGVLIWS